MERSGRTVTNDPDMLKATGIALDYNSVSEAAMKPLGALKVPYNTRDNDPRTRHFSECYNHLGFSVVRVHHALMAEFSATREGLDKMAANFARVEDENTRDVFSADFPPKLGN
jgi:hypothetical protein